MNPAIARERIRKLKKNTIAVLLIYVAIYYALLLLIPSDYVGIASDLMSPAGIIVSLIIMLYTIRFFSSGKTKWIWIIFLMGGAVFLIGDLNWAYTELIKGANPFASASDTWYLISAFLILIGFFLHIPQKSRFSAARSGFDVLIVMVIYVSLDIKYILLPIMNNIVLSAEEKLAALGYPIFDAGLFMVILLLYFNDADGKQYFRSRIMLVIAGTWFLADQFFSIQSILGIYQSGSWLDPLWAASFLGLSIVALQSAEFHLSTPESIDNSDRKSNGGIIYMRGFFTYGVMIIFLTMWCFQYYAQDPLSIGGIIVIFLLILRQYFALLENRRLLELLVQSNEELQEAKSRIEYELRTDYLTRLFNRRYVDVALAELQKAARINPTPFSVLVMDIDHFKNINDQYGHSAGDQVLQQIAKIICMNIRKDDIAARWGGEEFVVILPDSDESLAYSIGERIRSEIAGNQFKYDTGPQNIKLSVSIGISEVDSLEQDFGKVLLRADQGMYEAKDAGRNRTVIKRVS